MPGTDEEMSPFERDLLESVRQAVRGEYARVHTPAEMLARRGRGRPAGSTAPTRKVSTTIRFDADVIDAFRTTGDGWQTRMNAALKDWLKTHSPVS
jgi:uncharacterized protein (DUF4415 family)